MAEVQLSAEPQPGKVTTYVRSVRNFWVEMVAEMRKVTWPTREELTDATKRVLIMTVAIGAVIGILDWVLSKILIDGVAALTR
jgi:preprotein translocase subunit SecE